MRVANDFKNKDNLHKVSKELYVVYLKDLCTR